MSVDPGTRSPGSLYLVYTNGGYNHRCSAHFVDGVDIEDVAAARTDANAFAAAFKQVIPSEATILAWGLHAAGTSIGYEEPFSPTIPGTHAASAPLGYYSLTATMSGNGVATTVSGAKGKTRFVWFPGKAFSVAPGIKQYANSVDAGLVALANFFHTNLRLYADFFGQHAEPKAYITVQFNARVQQTHGT